MNGFQAPSSFGAVPSLLRPRQSPVSSQASRIAAIASERARDGVIFGLPFSRLASSSFGIGAATGTRLSALSTRPPGKTNLPGMNTTLSWRLPTSTFGWRRCDRPGSAWRHPSGGDRDGGRLLFLLFTAALHQSCHPRLIFCIVVASLVGISRPADCSSNPCMRNAHWKPTTAPFTGCSSSSDAIRVNGR